MSWAGRRRVGIATGIVLILASLTALSWYFFIYTPPSCEDNLQNQGEFGVDCEGPCAKLCTVPRVDALWSRAVNTAPGVYHGVALVKNPLPNARGEGLTYTMSLYDSGNILVAERRGRFDIEPGETRVIFEANVVTGERTPVRAFMNIDGGAWQRADVSPQTIRVIPGTLDEEGRVLTATIENTTALPVRGIVADALLYDAEGILVTASESRITSLPARGRQELVFTWPEAFPRDITTWDTIVRVNALP